MENGLGNSGRIVSRAVFADNFGITERTLRIWITTENMPGALPDGRVEVRLAHKWVVARQAERLAAQAGGKGARVKLQRAKASRRAELVRALDHFIGTVRHKRNTDPAGEWDAETCRAVMRATRDDTADGLMLHTDDDEKTFRGRLMTWADLCVAEVRKLYAAGVEVRDGVPRNRAAAK
jgi:hypothetical protein